MADRLGRIPGLVAEADAILVSAQADVRWATGFTGSNGLLVVLGDEAHFVTDGRYREQAASEVSGARIHIVRGDLLTHAAEKLLSGSPTIAVQSDHLTVARNSSLTRMLPGARWLEVENLNRAHRERKTEEEIDLIRRAQAITEEALQQTLKVIRPGITELEVVAELIHAHLSRGATGMSFDPIVASGPCAALPHARPTTRKIEAGELILIDVGCFFGGYASDMTRMVCIGQPAQKEKEVVAHVQRALELAMESAKAGMTSRELDAIARDYLTGVGLGEAFNHSLGHGVGLEIHEWPPVSFRSGDVLPEGAVITMEPGVYLPGEFGVRIEDMFVIRIGGVDRITKLSLDLIIL
ncbi:aminopeptidase P family protein [Rhodothermus sp. AH-315-K08]|nr:aminopeptidase P family protein [Rhodothermus sp. AH-315-K08]